MIVMRLAWIPWETRWFIVDFARRSPSARLYSLVPRSSQCPSMRTRLLALDFSHVALPSRVFASSARTSYLSKSKYTSLRFALSENSLGRGGAAAGAAAAGAAGAGAMGVGPEELGPEGAAGEGAGAGAGGTAGAVGAGAGAAAGGGRGARGAEGAAGEGPGAGAGATAEPVGAGADATGVAGRLGQPTRNSVNASRGITKSTEPRRC